MHMADTLISPAVGGTMWAVTAGVTAYSAKKMKGDFDERRVPLMGVLGAFIFAAQMINFSIPATGSSGHIGGGMILAILLGPYAGFLTIASVLVIQALFFADGGLLALGCNIFNLGFIPCFVAYPLLYRRIAGNRLSKSRILAGSTASAVFALQLGAFAVVLETLMSGITELPFSRFVLLMQPIHLAIGIIEGIITAGLMVFVSRARPELLESGAAGRRASSFSLKKVLIALGALAVICGGVLSWFASTHPDGLEWSMFRVAGKEEIEQPGKRVYTSAAGVQERLAFLPDYGFKRSETGLAGKTASSGDDSWPSVNAGTTVAGLVGGGITLLLAGLSGFLLIRRFSSGRNGAKDR